MADGYAGLSKHQLLKCASTNKKFSKFSVKFTSQAKASPVIVKRIHEQQHVDLVDMKGMEVEYKEKSDRYICQLWIYSLGFIGWLPLKERRVAF